MNKLIELAGRPSVVVRAMVDGLKYFDDSDEFRIDMGTFGRSDEDGICYGCAATCALQQLTGNTLTPDNIDLDSLIATEIQCSVSDVRQFEAAIDSLRHGVLLRLSGMFGAPMPEPEVRLWPLRTHTWREGLAVYEAYAEQLERAGL